MFSSSKKDLDKENGGEKPSKGLIAGAAGETEEDDDGQINFYRQKCKRLSHELEEARKRIDFLERKQAVALKHIKYAKDELRLMLLKLQPLGAGGKKKSKTSRGQGSAQRRKAARNAAHAAATAATPDAAPDAPAAESQG